MEYLTLLAIAVSLSFDTFVVALGCGVMKIKISFREAVRVSFVMAFFQGSFPLAGFFLGSVFQRYMEPVDHWFAFGLLFILGSRMLVSALTKRKDPKEYDITKPLIVITMGVGTSIDAFVVGLSLGLLEANIWFSSLTIAAVTFMAAMIAIRLGKSIGTRIGRGVEVAGGMILVIIGLKILLEHLAI
jgi:putative Mn2+ efflux pump MntP